MPPDASPAQPRLVPVRLGGPWKYGGQGWEYWGDGRCQGCNERGIYQVHDGNLEYTIQGKNYPSGMSAKDLEIRPPKDWPDCDLPEGTRLATDFVVGQRVRCKTNHKSAGVVTEVLPNRVNIYVEEYRLYIGFTENTVEGY